MSPARLRGLSLLGLLVLSGLVLLAWSQPWMTVTVADVALEVRGSEAAGALAPLALCGLLVVPALAIAGPAFRVVLGVLQALLGLCVVLQAAMVLADPVAASSGPVSATTGQQGATDALVDAVTLAPWPWVAVIAGALLLPAGIVVAISSRHWPRPTAKYQRTRFEPADAAAAAALGVEPGGDPDGDDAPRAVSPGKPGIAPAAATSAIDDWDALSSGDDPTSPSR